MRLIQRIMLLARSLYANCLIRPVCMSQRSQKRDQALASGDSHGSYSQLAQAVASGPIPGQSHFRPGPEDGEVESLTPNALSRNLSLLLHRPSSAPPRVIAAICRSSALARSIVRTSSRASIPEFAASLIMGNTCTTPTSHRAMPDAGYFGDRDCRSAWHQPRAALQMAAAISGGNSPPARSLSAQPKCQPSWRAPVATRRPELARRAALTHDSLGAVYLAAS
jgi:hypothetical protein